MPPKNITATKAISNDSVKITWEKTPNVDGYYLYYSETPNEFNELQRIEIIGEDVVNKNHRKPEKPYYYALSSYVSGDNGQPIEGPIQNYTDNISNYGYPLLPPNQVSSVDLGNGKLEYSFYPALGATGYILKIGDKSYNIDFSNPTATEGLTVSIATNGKITCVLANRPSVTKEAAIISNITSVNESEGALPDHNKSRTIDCSVNLDSLYDYEYVNLVVYGIAPLYAEADEKWKSDWWELASRKEFWTANHSVYFTRPSGALGWGVDGLFIKWENGYTLFDNYSFTDSVGNEYKIVSGKIVNRTTDTYDLETPLVRLYRDTPLTVIFPSYLGGKKVINFVDYYIDGSKGQITVDGVEIDISKITNRVL